MFQINYGKSVKKSDFIAISRDDMIKVQLNGRFIIDKKYTGKNIFVSFLEEVKVKNLQAR